MQSRRRHSQQHPVLKHDCTRDPDRSLCDPTLRNKGQLSLRSTKKLTGTRLLLSDKIGDYFAMTIDDLRSITALFVASSGGTDLEKIQAPIIRGEQRKYYSFLTSTTTLFEREKAKQYWSMVCQDTARQLWMNRFVNQCAKLAACSAVGSTFRTHMSKSHTQRSWQPSLIYRTWSSRAMISLRKAKNTSDEILGQKLTFSRKTSRTYGHFLGVRKQTPLMICHRRLR